MMTLTAAIRLLQRETMACWWPSDTFGRTGIDVTGVAGEVAALKSDIVRRQGCENEQFYVLDEANPETRTYDEITEALIVLQEAESQAQEAKHMTTHHHHGNAKHSHLATVAPSAESTGHVENHSDLGEHDCLRYQPSREAN